MKNPTVADVSDSPMSLSRRQWLQSASLGGSAWLLSGLLPTRTAAAEVDAEQLKRKFLELMANPVGPIPGAVVLVGTSKEILFHEAVGYARIVPERVPMQKNSIFDVASVTKVVATATACGILVDRGQLDPDAPLTKYLPDHVGEGVDKITLRHLASHTSGFRANPRLSSQGKGPDLIKAMLTNSPQWQVGTRNEYACRNLIHLSTIVERVSGMPFGDFCTKEIFEPIGMTESKFNKVPVTDRVVAHHMGGNRLGVCHNQDTWAAKMPLGNAGLFTTPIDLSKFCQMMLNGGTLNGKRVLSRERIEDFTKTFTDPKLPAYGFVWSTRSKGSHRPSRLSDKAYGHAGYTGQAVWIDPGKDLFTLVMSNRTHGAQITADNEKDAEFRLPKPAGDLQMKEAQYEILASMADATLKALGN